MTPAPILDHIVANVHQRMDDAAALYARLGFALTPRGHHTLGSINHLAIFATDYLELIGLPPGATGRQDLLTWPAGWNGVVFNTEDAAALAIPRALPPNDFSRPVALPSGTRDAAFRTVRLPPETTTAGRLYFCQHRTRDLVWRDEWRRHPNGATGIARVVFAADDPSRLAGVFAALFGADRVHSTAEGAMLLAGLVRIEVISRAACAARYGDAADDPAGRAEWIAAMEFRVPALAQARAALHRGDIALRAGAGGLIVPAGHTMGAAMIFAEG